MDEGLLAIKGSSFMGESTDQLEERLQQHRMSVLAAFVRKHGGNRVIQRILIANNGIAAVKEIRSIRRWAYEVFGDDRMIEFTVMATPEDLKGNAEYIKMADAYVQVPGGPNNNNYANVELIVDLAERHGVQVISSIAQPQYLPFYYGMFRRCGPDGGMHRRIQSCQRCLPGRR